MTDDGNPIAKREPTLPGLKPFLTKSDLLSLPLADPELKDDVGLTIDEAKEVVSGK